MSSVKTPRSRTKAIPDPGRRRSGRPKNNEQRIGADELVRQCCEMLKTVPPAKLSAAALARHTGVTPALVNYYFKDRAELMLAVARQFLGELERLSEAGERPDETAEQALRRRVRGLLQMHQTYPYFHEVLLHEVINASTPAGRQMLSEATSMGLGAFAAVIEKGRVERSFEPSSPLFFYIAVLGMCEFFATGAPLVEHIHEDAPMHTLVDGYAEFIVQMMLKGFRPEP